MPQHDGHAAEAVVFGEVTTGASDDIERATLIVRRMVTEFGMSERLGPVAFGHKQQLIFLGRDIGEHRDYSERWRAKPETFCLEARRELAVESSDIGRVRGARWHT